MNKDFETRRQEREMLDRAWESYQIELYKKLRKMRKVELVKNAIIFVMAAACIVFISMGVIQEIAKPRVQ